MQPPLSLTLETRLQRFSLVSAEETIEFIIADAFRAEMLDVAEEHPLILVERVVQLRPRARGGVFTHILQGGPVSASSIACTEPRAPRQSERSQTQFLLDETVGQHVYSRVNTYLIQAKSHYKGRQINGGRRLPMLRVVMQGVTAPV